MSDTVLIDPGVFTVTCRKCTRQAVYLNHDLATAAAKSHAAGWVMEGDTFICPKCPKPSEPATKERK